MPKSMETMRILHLTLHRHWFCEILAGRKTREYRALTPYWERRLIGQTYDIVRFRNGYATDAPWMEVEWLGLARDVFGGEKVHAISLGRLLGSGNTACLSRAEVKSPPRPWRH